MKKNITNVISPFIMLLVPLFLLTGILATNINNEMPVEMKRASIKLQVPSLKSLFQVVAKK